MKIDKFDKRHPRNKCPRCGQPNYLPNEGIPEHAGARLGINLQLELMHPSLWKANGGPGAVTAHWRLCGGCSADLTNLLEAGKFIVCEPGEKLEPPK